ncbi:MAG: glycine--tRNA ligase subunit beta [bacterium]
MDTQDLLFELGTEELPPLALQTLADALTQGFVSGLDSAKLSHGDVRTFAAPRRLGILIESVAVEQADQQVERKGPAVKAAFDADGNPTKAAEGFAKSCGTTVAELEQVDTPKGAWLMFKQNVKGQKTSALLPDIAEQSLTRLPIPKRMRWGDSDAQFVRPVHWVVFMLGNDVVPCTLLDAEAGNQTYGHRFHHPDAIALSSPSDYEAALRAPGHVIADFAARREHIREQVKASADALGAVVMDDDALLDEVTALNEWPIPITGSFEEEFLAVPQEALVLTMKKNQKYFPLFDSEGKLRNHFITIANVDSPRPELISAGNERVVRPRLADAKFFWEQDAKQTLADRLPRLETIVFQQKLGSMHDKSMRVAALAAHIAEQIDGDAQLAARAGQLSRCDLVTEMVGEFADMQGVMGRYQATRDGEPAEVALAMEEFYLPRFAGDHLPETKTGIAIALAERLDTLVGIFGIDMKPTGDKDPFALRRAALGVLRIISEHSLTLDVRALITFAAEQLADSISDIDQVQEDVFLFLVERLRGQFHDQGVSSLLFAAVAAVDPKLLTDYAPRIKAVDQFQALPEAEALAAANKRIGNILKKAEEAIPAQVDDKLLEADAEKALAEQINQLQATITPLLNEQDYSNVLKALATLQPAVDAFFDDVMVNVDDPAVRTNRLALLQRLRNLFLTVADISQLQG